MAVTFTKFLSQLILPVLLATIAVQAQSTGHGTFTCKTYGRYSDPNDCMAYYECLPTFTSTRLSVKKQRCPAGKGFHDKLKKCVSLKKLKECNSRQGRFEDINTELNPLCATPDVHFICADCQTLVHCIDGVAFTTKCDAAMSCAVIDSFESGVCSPHNTIEDCSCMFGNNKTFRPDPYDESKFFTCGSEESLPEFFECPVNRVFNDSLQKCTDGEGMPSCSTEGTFSVPENCTKYYSCLQTKYSWLQRAYECEPKQMYSESRGMCEDPCQWQNGDFKCTKEGRFSNPSDCKTFYVCILNGTDFILKKRSCPSPYNWLSNEDNTSGKCTDDLSLCKPVTQHSCDIPTDLCPASETASSSDTSGSGTSGATSTGEEPSSSSDTASSGAGTPESSGAETVGSSGTETEGSGGAETVGSSGAETEGSGGVETEGSSGAETEESSGAENEGSGGTETEGSGTTGTLEENGTAAGESSGDSPLPLLRTGSEQLKKEDPIAFIRNLLNRP